MQKHIYSIYNILLEYDLLSFLESNTFLFINTEHHNYILSQPSSIWQIRKVALLTTINYCFLIKVRTVFRLLFWNYILTKHAIMRITYVSTIPLVKNLGRDKNEFWSCCGFHQLRKEISLDNGHSNCKKMYVPNTLRCCTTKEMKKIR